MTDIKALLLEAAELSGSMHTSRGEKAYPELTDKLRAAAASMGEKYEPVFVGLPASAVPEAREFGDHHSEFDLGYSTGWNDCRDAMLAAPEPPMPDPETIGHANLKVKSVQRLGPPEQPKAVSADLTREDRENLHRHYMQEAASNCCCGESDQAWRLCPIHGPEAFTRDLEAGHE